MRKIVLMAASVLAVWGFSANAGVAADLAGLRPGMTLAEAKAVTLPGLDKKPKRRIGCLDESGLADNMVGLMKSDVAKEAKVGVLTCSIIEPDSMNTSYWSPADVDIGGADVSVWLPFVTEADGTQRLAEIVVNPARQKDEKALLGVLSGKFGQPKAGSRAFVAMMSGREPEPVQTWNVAGQIVDLEADGSFAYFYDPALVKDLDARLAKLPGRSFLYAVPQLQ